MKRVIPSFADSVRAISQGFAVLAVVGFSLMSTESVAHHAFSSVFDPNTPLNVEGTVTKVEWMNPHTWFYIDVSDGDGADETWGFEMGSPNTLSRRGWNRDSLKIGDEIIVVGWRARDGSMRGAVASVTLADGRQLFGAQDTSR
jgi:hypothetical protein